jgi:hypothetical protein
MFEEGSFRRRPRGFRRKPSNSSKDIKISNKQASMSEKYDDRPINPKDSSKLINSFNNQPNLSINNSNIDTVDNNDRFRNYEKLNIIQKDQQISTIYSDQCYAHFNYPNNFHHLDNSNIPYKNYYSNQMNNHQYLNETMPYGSNIEYNNNINNKEVYIYPKAIDNSQNSKREISDNFNQSAIAAAVCWTSFVSSEKFPDNSSLLPVDFGNATITSVNMTLKNKESPTSIPQESYTNQVDDQNVYNFTRKFL